MRIVVTRPEAHAGELVRRLEALGHAVVVCPLIAIEPLGGGPVDLAGYDWVVVTSRTAAELLAGRAVGPWPPVAAIGPGSGNALREAGHEPALVPAVSTQEGLVAEFPRPAGRVLFAGAEGARRPRLGRSRGSVPRSRPSRSGRRRPGQRGRRALQSPPRRRRTISRVSSQP
jgi:uroporphyrinogen-III synthase